MVEWKKSIELLFQVTNEEKRSLGQVYINYQSETRLEGALGPEFLQLARLSGNNKSRIDTRDFQKFLSKPIPSVHELATKIHESVSLSTIY